MNPDSHSADLAKCLPPYAGLWVEAEEYEQLKRELAKVKAHEARLILSDQRLHHENMRLRDELAEAKRDRDLHRQAAHGADMRTQAAVRAEKKAIAALSETRRTFEDGLDAVQRELDLVVVEHENEESLIQHLTDRISALKKVDPQAMRRPAANEVEPVGSAPCVVIPLNRFQNWAEYWNGSVNQRAMEDALNFLMNEFDQFLRLDERNGV